MLTFNTILRKHFKLSEFIMKFVRPYYMDDRFSSYFRKNNNYKNCILQLNDDFKENKLAGPGVSFLVKDQDIQTDKIFSHLMRRENVMKLTMLQLKDTMYLMASTKIDTVKYETILTNMDEKCAINIERWNFDFCLYILDAWLIILGHNAFRKHYYSALINLLNKKMKRCSKYNFVLTLYFIGLSKRSPPFLKELVEYKMENFILDFTDEEFAIACLSLFKTSTKVNSELFLKQCITAAKNLVIKNERFHLISILKCLRLSQYFDTELINVIENYVLKEYASFNFVECTNFLAYFATKNIYCFEIYNCIENHGIELLSNETDMTFNKTVEKIHPSQRSRVKDLARFLWGMAFVGHNINKESVNFIIEQLTARLNSTEFETNLPALVDCFQSLVLLGYYPVDMVKYVLNPSFFYKISTIDKAKPKYQLYFISRSAYVENFVDELLNTKYINNIPKDLQNDISQRIGLKEIIEYLNGKLGKKSFITCYIMPHIMISGIVVASNPRENLSNKLVYSNVSKLIEKGIISKSLEEILHKDKMYTCIELLDQTVCAKGSNTPLGLMKTKIRQLQKLNFNVITLTPEEISSLSKSKEHEQCSKLQNLL